MAYAGCAPSNMPPIEPSYTLLRQRLTRVSVAVKPWATTFTLAKVRLSIIFPSITTTCYCLLAYPSVRRCWEEEEESHYTRVVHGYDDGDATTDTLSSSWTTMIIDLRFSTCGGGRVHTWAPSSSRTGTRARGGHHRLVCGSMMDGDDGAGLLVQRFDWWVYRLIDWNSATNAVSWQILPLAWTILPDPYHHRRIYLWVSKVKQGIIETSYLKPWRNN
jgi:hypothetical protein